MHKNAKKQFDLQGLVQDLKLTLSYDNGYRAISYLGGKPLPRETDVNELTLMLQKSEGFRTRRQG
jgi:hypothetical protein